MKTRFFRGRRTPFLLLAPLLTLLVMLPLSGFAGVLPAASQKNLRVKVLAFNDFHGQLSPKTFNGRPIGGAAVLAAYLKKAQNGMKDHTLIVSAGDLEGASPANSALLQDEPSVMFLSSLANRHCSNRMSERCNLVATVGNHEFDEGLAELQRMLDGGNHVDGPFLEFPYTGAHYPCLAANVIDVNTNETLLHPYVVKKVGKARIAFIGAVLKEAPSMVSPSGVESLRFIDEADAINRCVRDIKTKGIKAIVAVIHQGGDAVNGIVGRLDGEIDVVISGHTHQLTNTTVNNAAGKPVLVTQAYSAGVAYADIDLEIDPRARDIVKKTATVSMTWGDTGAGLKPDREAAALVAAADAAVQDKVNAVIGTAAHDIVRLQSPAGESPLGNLIADALRRYGGTDFAFMNPGGIRANIPAGAVSWGTLFSVQPFGNRLVRMTLTGRQIYDLLAQQWENPSPPRMLQISGLSYRWTDNGPGVPGTVSTVMKNGIPIDREATYTVTVNSFLAEGGDDFTVFREGFGTVMEAEDIDVLVSHIRDLPQPFTAAIENRIGRTETKIPHHGGPIRP